MKRYIIWLLLAGMLLSALGACQQQGTPTTAAAPDSATATTAATATPQPTSTPQAVATPTSKQEATPTSGAEVTPTGGQEPGATATPPWQIPPVTEDDWGKGNPDAGMVLVEYSDLQ